MGIIGGTVGPGVRADDITSAAPVPYQWLNDKGGNPLAAWVPGKGWVQPQNASYNVDGKLSGLTSFLDPKGGKSLSNTFYEQQRDAQIANTGGYVLGSATPFSAHATSLNGIDTSGMTPQQRALFDPTSNFGSSGYEIFGSPTDPNVSRPGAIYKEQYPEWTFMQHLFGNYSEDGWLGVANSPGAAFSAAAGGVAAGAGAAAGASGSAGAAGGADAAFAAGATGGAAGPSFGGLTAAEAAGGLSAGSAGLSGGGMDFGAENMFSFEGGSGWDYNEFLQSVGIDPSSTQFSGGTLSNEAIMADIMGGTSGSIYQDLAKKMGEQWAKSLLSKFMSGEATAGDYANLLGKLGAAGLGMLGSSQQSNSLAQLAQQYQQYGAPSRARFEASMSPGFDPNSIPGYAGALDSTSKSLLARLSATGGNPFGNPGGLIDANKQIVAGTALPAINEYQRLNANTGFGSSMNAALGLQTQGIGADANIYNSLGYGLNALTNQQPKQTSLEDLMKSLNMGGLA